eukprot:1154994-Pelagomonas_calceolata.AAC.7
MHEPGFEGSLAPAGHHYLCVDQACSPRALAKIFCDCSSSNILACSVHLRDDRHGFGSLRAYGVHCLINDSLGEGITEGASAVFNTATSCRKVHCHVKSWLLLNHGYLGTFYNDNTIKPLINLGLTRGLLGVGSLGARQWRAAEGGSGRPGAWRTTL